MTGEELVFFARSKIGTPYVYGMKGTVMTQANYNYLQNRYGKKCVWDSDEKKVGMVCVDCSGLISWATGNMLGSSQLFEQASRKESIDSIKNAPIGALVWMRGHVGIFTGMRGKKPYYIAADGSAYGVREVPLSQNHFTHWLLMDYITYQREDPEMVEKGKVVIDGKAFEMELIFKNGTNFVKIRDLGEALGCKVTSKGRIPVLDRN